MPSSSGKSTTCLYPLVIAACSMMNIANTHAGDLPSSFDLRDYNGVNYVTPVREQTGGTCWCFGTMGAFEGNLMMTGAWNAAGEAGKPDMAEYHLDWWNGFNKFNNDDIDPNTGDGLNVHNGGDYRVATAYFSRGDGAVRDRDGQSFDDPPARNDASYHHYYPRDVVWMTAGENLENMDEIKRTIMEHGCIAMCMGYYSALMVDYHHYQPPEDERTINHSLTIIGWDDNEPTQAPLPGAWLVKNSWGADWGLNGYFWVSYYDKACAQHPEMGCVSFQNIVLNEYDYTYYHDYHGWRSEMTEATEAFNAFVGVDRQMLEAVSFFTMADDVEYTFIIYDDYENGELSNGLLTQSGIIAKKGYHTVDLMSPLYIFPDDDFYVYVQLSDGGQAYDCTGNVEEMMGAPPSRAIVTSTASPGESFYKADGVWCDLTDLNESANFCIKAFATKVGLEVQAVDAEAGESFIALGDVGGPFDPLTKAYRLTNTDSESIDYEISAAPCCPWISLTGLTAGALANGESVNVSVEINGASGYLPEGYNQGIVRFDNVTTLNGSTTRAVEVLAGEPDVFYEWTFDVEPADWDPRAGWDWGIPQGQGGQNGYPDPTSGRTGDYVFGYELGGDYPNNLGFKSLRTPYLDVPQPLLIARLTYWRWLGVQGGGLDNAGVAVDADDCGYQFIWTAEDEITDNEWVYQDFDITPMIQDAQTMRFRWNMGKTDESGTYCGWNIDDVRIVGYSQIQPVIGDLDGNGEVDMQDLIDLLENYGSTDAQPSDGDLDGDGVISISDLATLLGNYNCACRS